MRERRHDLPWCCEMLARMAGEIEAIPSPGSGGIQALALFEQLVTYRNKVIGHAGAYDEAFYRKMADSLFAAAVEVLGTLPLFGRGGIIAAGALREERAGERAIALWNLTGPEVVRIAPSSGAPTSSAPQHTPGHLYLRLDGFDLDLHPLLVAEPAPPGVLGALPEPDGPAPRCELPRLRFRPHDFPSSPGGGPPQIPGRVLDRPLTPSDVDSLGDQSIDDNPEDAAEVTEVLDLGTSSSPDEQIGPYLIHREIGRGGQAASTSPRTPGRPEGRAQGPHRSRRPSRRRPSPLPARGRGHVEARPSRDLSRFEAGQEHGMPYIAMRYVEGETLARKIATAREAARPDEGARSG